MNVYWALQQIKPQDLEAQIQALIEKEQAPADQIKAEHEILEDVARQRAIFQQMAASELITLHELEVQIAELTTRNEAADRRLEMLQSTNERIERLKLMKKNPILRFVEQTTEQRRDYYKDLELRVVIYKDEAEIKGIFGCQSVTPTSTSGTKR